METRRVSEGLSRRPPVLLVKATLAPEGSRPSAGKLAAGQETDISDLFAPSVILALAIPFRVRL